MAELRAAAPCAMAVPTMKGPMPLLPRRAYWFYVITPPLLVFLLYPEAFAWGPGELLTMYAVKLICTVILGGAFHALYAWVVPRMLHRTHSFSRRIGVHIAALITALAVGVPLSFAALTLAAPFTGHEARLARLFFLATTFGVLLMIPVALLGELRREAREIARREQLATQTALHAQLSALQARVNPHFLFNALNSLAALIPEDPNAAERAVEKLASVFRYTLEGSRRSSVPLASELEAVRAYLSVEEIRFGSRLRYEEHVDPSARHVPIPPLSLLPVVENAVLHAVGAARRGATIRLEVERRKTDIEIVVEDDGPGPRRSSRRGSGKTIGDLKERLRVLYDGRQPLSVETVAEGGYRARFLLDAQGPRITSAPSRLYDDADPWNDDGESDDSSRLSKRPVHEDEDGDALPLSATAGVGTVSAG